VVRSLHHTFRCGYRLPLPHTLHTAHHALFVAARYALRIRYDRFCLTIFVLPVIPIVTCHVVRCVRPHDFRCAYRLVTAVITAFAIVVDRDAIGTLRSITLRYLFAQCILFVAYATRRTLFFVRCRVVAMLRYCGRCLACLLHSLLLRVFSRYVTWVRCVTSLIVTAIALFVAYVSSVPRCYPRFWWVRLHVTIYVYLFYIPAVHR